MDSDYFDDGYFDTYDDTPVEPDPEPEPVEMREYFVLLQAQWANTTLGGATIAGWDGVMALDPTVTKHQQFQRVIEIWNQWRVDNNHGPLPEEKIISLYHVVPNTPDAPTEVPA